MPRQEEKVSVADLEVGMYVSRLDRPWIETPFLLEGFGIKGEADIEQLKQYCKFVYIDVERGQAVGRNPDALSLSRSGAESPAEAAQPAAKLYTAPIVIYEDTVSVEEEIRVAEEIYRDMSTMVEHMTEGVRAGNKLNSDLLQRNLGLIVDSILRNPNAFMWLISLRTKDAYAYSHSIGTCILAAAFGRYLGLSKQRLQTLAAGGLLFDVGKARLPAALLTKAEPLSKAELARLKKHVTYSVEVLEQTEHIDPDVIEMVRTHHERHDGSGYPRGLKGEQIPTNGMIAAIVDCYDSMISSRAYKKPVSPYHAISALYELRGTELDEHLVEQFMQFMGVYPVGTLVELSTGEVGIVISQTPARRLQPKVMLILDKDKQRYDFCPVVDLMQQSDDKPRQKLRISKALDPGTYGIDPTKVGFSR